jgi:tetratricopeptide (TPR) repeat protein
MSALAQTALSSGADLYVKGRYDEAARAFQRSIGLDPSPENVAQASDLLATVYLKQNKTTEAIKAYKSSISRAPTDDNAHIKLGNIYFGQARYNEAENEYKAAVAINPTSSTNIFSLGQVYLAQGRYHDAETRFKQIIQMDPRHYGGYYALGQTYSKEGRAKEAVELFKKVNAMKKDFNEVRVDLGSAYVDLGDMDKAQEQLDLLYEKDAQLYLLLYNYVDKAAKPKLLAAIADDGFATALGPGTSLTSMSSALANANASKSFHMTFVFSKDMDASSVMNPVNWRISKATSNPPSGAYNWGLPNSASDADVSSMPSNIIYLEDSLSATISFTVRQNETADATIDPSHIVFKFSGLDAYGNAMDLSADEYSGFSTFA